MPQPSTRSNRSARVVAVEATASAPHLRYSGRPQIRHVVAEIGAARAGVETFLAAVDDTAQLLAHLPDRIRQAGALFVGAHPVAVAEQHRDRRGDEARQWDVAGEHGQALHAVPRGDVVGPLEQQLQFAAATVGRDRFTTIGCAAPLPRFPPVAT